jgi:GTP-binding protein EngB required for normal cell division
MTGSAAFDRARPADWPGTVRSLAKRSGTAPEGLQYLAHIDGEFRPVTTIGLVGAPNTGKSSLVNGLAGKRLVPVSALPSHHAFVIVCTDGADPEQPAPAAGAAPNAPPVSIRVNDPWLAARQLSILEKAALDVPDAECADAVHRSLRGVDLVVLVMDALMPVRRSETVVLSECARRGLPTIVALMKTDRLPPEERGSISEYVKKQIQSYASTAPLVEIGTSSEGVAGIEQLKGAIDDALAAADFPAVRFRQTVEECLHVLEPISAAAVAALQMQKKTAEERSAEGRRRRLAGDEQAALWNAIANQLQSRRQALDEKIRKGLDLKRQSITEVLLNDLEGRTDIKSWWERELPFRLSRELRSAAESLSNSANRQIGADLRWLQEELTRSFRLPQAAISLDASVSLEGGDVPKKDMAVWNTNKLRVVTRLGQAATMLMAGRLVLTSGLSGATIGLSILAGLAAEQFMVLAAKKDRQKVREQLDSVVERASIEYAQDVSRKLKAGYDEIMEALRIQQQRWQRAQEAAFQMVQTTEAKDIDWQSIVNQANALEQEMRAAIATPRA